MVKEMHLQEKTLFDLGLGSMSRNVAQYPRHHVTYAPAKLMLLHPRVKERMHFQENTLSHWATRS